MRSRNALERLKPIRDRSGEMVKLAIGVCPRDGDPTCSMRDVLAPLVKNGQLPRWIEAIENSASNTLDIPLALMLDLIQLERAHGWRWMRGDVPVGNGKLMQDHWLEYDGWAIDASPEHGVMVVDVNFHRATTRVRRARARNAAQTIEWLERADRNR